MWNVIRRAGDNDVVKFSVALKQRNLDQLDALFWAVSNPQSPEYGHFRTADEVLDLIAPEKEAHDAVATWLASEGGVVSIVSHRDMFRVALKAPQAERLLGTSFFVYKHAEHGMEVVRQEAGYRVAEHVAPHIDFLTGLTDFPYPKRSLKDSANKKIADATYDYVIPQTVRRVYNIPADTVVTNKNTSQTVIEFYPYAAPEFADLILFAKQADEIFTNISVIIGEYMQSTDLEAELDTQLLYSLGSKAENWYWTVEGWAYEMGVAIFNNPVVPNVASVSYGWPEYYTCQSSVTQANCTGLTVEQYVNRSNIEFQKVGLRGVSLLIATQDEGAPSEANEGCALDNTDMPVFAIFPSSSPYVTAVSGTTLGPESASKADVADPPICAKYPCSKSSEESPCMSNNTEFSWTTGGGFSVYGARPDYQTDAVAEWFAQKGLAPPTSKFPSTKRGYADVSAIGDRYLIYAGQQITIGAGTSAATPVFAGVVTLLNDHRHNQGKPSLGFLNPLLYQAAKAHPASFKDITWGNNKCTIDTCCAYGYGATHGWDPVSGLGTPNFQELIAYIDSLQY